MNGNTINLGGRIPPESEDVLIVLGAIVTVALIVFFCVLLFRKDEKHRHKHHHRHHRKSYREQFQKATSEIKELIRQRRSRSRREHRRINPTLAQTGGLPPIHEPGKPPPPPPQP
jgi:type VI protein secretion system component VasK